MPTTMQTKFHSLCTKHMRFQKGSRIHLKKDINKCWRFQTRIALLLQIQCRSPTCNHDCLRVSTKAVLKKPRQNGITVRNENAPSWSRSTRLLRQIRCGNYDHTLSQSLDNSKIHLITHLTTSQGLQASTIFNVKAMQPIPLTTVSSIYHQLD